MGIRSYMKNTAKANTNVKAWADWNSIRNSAGLIKRLVTDVQPDAPPQKHESFDAAAQHFGLSEADLKKRALSHNLTAIGFFVFTLVALSWAVYVLLHGNSLMSVFVSLCVAFLMGTYTVSQAVFAYRIKQRRLDCSIKEWFLHFFNK